VTTGKTRPSARTVQLLPEGLIDLRCQQCGAVRGNAERFCESCGHDHTLPVTWSLEISAEGSHLEDVASDLVFPAGRMPAVVVFDTDEIVIGRRKPARGIDPHVDLSGPLADPGVSHRHAMIRRDPAAGLFAIIDLGSTNGTTINGDERPIEPNQAVQLAAGDRIHVGAWTTLRVIV